ncbi:MAG: sigma-70 family RNA polymerase sigma factor [Alphaproteobacteria bacterium]|nr:sigma-70 family RNA polymerase sigma factor [Alphaproteobacteria bacterium]MBQ7285943.1 sigma-70 family RNA polymerase sigma factor [Alphaproteobacteria bacterium]
MTAEQTEHRNLIRAVIKKLTGSYNEDLEQEVYLRAWQNRDKYQDKGKVRAWLSTLTANLCRDYFKSRFFREDKNKIGGDELLEKIVVQGKQEERLDAKTRQKIILKAVDALPAPLRKVVVWYEFEEMPYAEIARRLDIPEGTVKSRLSTARKILAEQLKFLRGE